MATKAQSPQSPSYGLYRLLSQDERKLLEEQKQLIEASRHLASKVEATARSTEDETLSVLSSQQYSSRHFLEGLQLEATFSVVVAGEFNAGKSTLINALLGNKLLETGALPTTDSITVIRAAGVTHGVEEEELANDAEKDEYDSTIPQRPQSSSPSLSQSPLGVVVHSVEDLPLLEDLTLVDTPGTNSAWIDHTERTKKMLPAADLILFVTSADRPFSESERILLQSIQAYRKNIVVIINKMDILEETTTTETTDGKQKAAIVEFVTDKASELLGARPVVLPVSGRDALEAKLPESSLQNEAERSVAWQKSNFGALESFLKETLTRRAKVRSKLSNPIGVAEAVMAECLRVLDDQSEELRADFATLAMVESQFEGWKKELSADLDLSRTRMTTLVEQEGQRCEIMFHRMKNPIEFYSWTLSDRDRLEEEWSITQREVSTTIHRQHGEDLKADLIEHVIETADSVATRGRAQGQAVIEYLGKRPSVKDNQSSLVGSVTAVSRFEETRKNLIEKLTHAVDDVFSVPGKSGQPTTKAQREELDKDRLFASMKQTAMISSSFHATALGSAVMLALPSVEIDPTTGWLGVASLLAGGGTTLALGKSRIKEAYKEQWSRRARNLQTALETIATKEAEVVHRRIEDGVAPYTRFVAIEKDRIEALKEECERVASAARNLRNRVQKLP